MPPYPPTDPRTTTAQSDAALCKKEHAKTIDPNSSLFLNNYAGNVLSFQSNTNSRIAGPKFAYVFHSPHVLSHALNVIIRAVFDPPDALSGRMIIGSAARARLIRIPTRYMFYSIAQHVLSE